MKSAEHFSAWAGKDEATDESLGQVLSAAIDGEAGFEGVELDSSEVRQRWTVYHLIGDVLREPTATTPVTSEFAARMSAALAREAAHGLTGVAVPSVQTAVRKPVGRWRQAVLAWPGLAVAAAVASVVWVAQPLFELEQQSQQAMSVAQNEPASPAAAVIEQVRPESDYVSAHRQMAGPVAVRQVAFTPGVD